MDELEVIGKMLNCYIKGISKNPAFDHLILNPSPKGEGQKEFL